MRIGAFEVTEPLPELVDPSIVSILHPWVDAGRVGSLILTRLEEHFKAQEVAKLAIPGQFFDFTRYRPTTHYVEEHRVFTVPNCTLTLAQREGESDLLFFHLLEPHAFAEEYVESILELLKTLGAKRHCRLGAMYDAVPHTRPLPVTQSIGGQQVDRRTGQLLPRRRRYQGPTSIMNLVGEGMDNLGIENMSLMVRLPYYAQLEEDYAGAARLLEILCELYKLPSSLLDSFLSHQQYREINAEIASNPAAKSLVQRLEADYDAEENDSPPKEEPPPLSPEVEKFLREIDKDFGSN
ncbi:MAG: putative ATP-dependent carboligase, ATP-grasp superfamily [Dehalococcoidia bacterium]|nr:putative ATP-dependent carboligase, ATP-grasp superfamily [Dehalococcoidia bacterium]